MFCFNRAFLNFIQWGRGDGRNRKRWESSKRPFFFNAHVFDSTLPLDVLVDNIIITPTLVIGNSRKLLTV